MVGLSTRSVAVGPGMDLSFRVQGGFMESRTQLFVEARRAARPFERESPLLQDLKVSQAIEVGLRLLGMPRVNVLLVGLNDGVWPLVESAVLDLDQPITSWRPGEDLKPPTASGTLILHDIGAMPPMEQCQLLDWMWHSAGSVRVISTTSTHMVPLLEAGIFNETLYHRLNTLCVDLTD